MSLFIFQTPSVNEINRLNPSGYYTYHLLLHTKTLLSAHRICLCVSYGSHNKQH
jgi:hypothetical protein